jgi:hypothetical protein
VNFTDKNIPLIYTEEITVGKKIKTKLKNMMTCHLYKRNCRQNLCIDKIVGKLLTLLIMSIIKRIINEKFQWYFPESSGTVYFPIAPLIIVLYR